MLDKEKDIPALIQNESDIELYKEINRQPSTKAVIAFELMIQFIERCREDGKNPFPYQNAAIHIACGCSIDGKSNAPTADGGRVWFR
jgi:hypothetical protein